MNVIGGFGCGKAMLLDAMMKCSGRRCALASSCALATHHDADISRRHADQAAQIDTGEPR
jgi:hypothetical protein